MNEFEQCIDEWAERCREAQAECRRIEVLYAQLQATLTARDERIKELEAVRHDYKASLTDAELRDPEYMEGYCSDFHQDFAIAIQDKVKSSQDAARLKAELNETWVDERGTVWTRPTAWAYAMVCKARDKHEQDAARLRAALERIVIEAKKEPSIIGVVEVHSIAHLALKEAPRTETPPPVKSRPGGFRTSHP